MVGCSAARTYRNWPNLQAFYDERGGECSGESDFGVHNWANAARDRESSFDKWRVSVVADTGDVYAFDYNGKEVLLLGTVVPMDADSATAERINARWSHDSSNYPAMYCAADRLLEGWAGRESLGRPLHWSRSGSPGSRERRNDGCVASAAAHGRPTAPGNTRSEQGTPEGSPVLPVRERVAAHAVRVGSRPPENWLLRTGRAFVDGREMLLCVVDAEGTAVRGSPHLRGTSQRLPAPGCNVPAVQLATQGWLFRQPSPVMELDGRGQPEPV